MAAKEVSENMHINNIPTGAPEDDSAVKLMNELCNLLSSGVFQLKMGFKLEKVTETTPLCDRAPTRVPTSEPKKNDRLIKCTGYFMEHEG